MGYESPDTLRSVRPPDTGHMSGRTADDIRAAPPLPFRLACTTAAKASFKFFPKEPLMASRRPTPESPRTSTAAPPNPPPSNPSASNPESSVSPTSSTAPKSTAARKPKAPREKPVTVPAPLTRIEISEDVRRGMIAEAAYLRAERRGFTGGPDKEREDWLAAEAAVDALLKGGHGSSAQ